MAPEPKKTWDNSIKPRYNEDEPDELEAMWDEHANDNQGTQSSLPENNEDDVDSEDFDGKTARLTHDTEAGSNGSS